MLSKIFQKEKEVGLNDVKSFTDSRELSQITVESVAGKETYSILEAFFNGYAFTFILNVDRNNLNRVRDIILLVKDRNRRNKVKYSNHYFFAVVVPDYFSASKDSAIGISLIKESHGYIVGYKDIYRCRLYGNYAYNQKVLCENLYDLPLVFRKFIEENQDKPERFLEFFLNFKMD